MDETTSTELIASYEAWTAAEAAFRDQAGKHVDDVSWAEGRLPHTAAPLTETEYAIRKLEQLSVDARAKRQAYHELLRSHGLAE